MDTLELDVAAETRRRPMRRRLTGILVGALVALTSGGLIVAAQPGGTGALGELLHGTPTPTATIPLAGDTLYFEHGAPWGRLTVDGRPVTVGATPRMDLLARGRHTVVYQADPFPSLRCTISTPASASDICPLDTAFTDSFGHPLGARRAVDLGSTLARLPAELRTSLVETVRSLVEYTSPVAELHPGEHYAGINGGLITRETATRPLNVSIQFRLQSEPAGADGNPVAPDCASVCLPPVWSSGTLTTPAPDTLEVWAHVKRGYHYIVPDGVVVLDYGPLGQTQQSAWHPDDIVALRVGWNGVWQVASATSNDMAPPCRYGSGDLSPGPSAGLPAFLLPAARPAPNPTDGCLLILRRQTDGKPSGPPALFLERFGVLLAVDEGARAFRPYLPLAGPDEAALAYAIAALAPLP